MLFLQLSVVFGIVNTVNAKNYSEDLIVFTDISPLEYQTRSDLQSANETLPLMLDSTIYGYYMAGEAFWWDSDGDGEPDTVYTYSGKFYAKTKRNGVTVTDTLILTFTPSDAGPLACDPELWFNDASAPDTIFVNTKTDTTLSFRCVNEDFDSYEWFAIEKQDEQRIAQRNSPTTTITVSPKDTAVYVLKTTFISPEDYQMVFNGNFEYGNIAFSSDFTYKPKPSPDATPGGFGWGVYAIGQATKGGQYWCPGDFNGAGWAHYPMTGSPYLFADGQQVSGGQKFYSTTFSVEKNQDYIFQAKFANLNSGGSFENPGKDYAIFRFFVNDQPASDYDTLKSTWGEWQELYTVFNTGDDTLATVTVKNFGISTNGNDFCLDDVSFLKYCQHTDTIVIINDYTIRVKQEKSICDNETYNFNGKTLTDEGFYIDTLKTAEGIDSIITLNLKVNPTYETFFDTTICEDNLVVFNGQTYTEAGDYVAHLQTELGCDSVAHLHLDVLKKTYKNIDTTIFAWQDYYFEDSLIRDAGTYMKIIPNANDCDSIITLNLRYKDKIYKNEIVCEGEEYIFGTQVLTEAGVYTDTLTAANGNDSIIVLSLESYPQYNDTIYAKIGVGQVYDRWGFYESEPGTYISENISIEGCDSNVVLFLTVDMPVDIFVPNAFTPSSDNNNVFQVLPASEDIVVTYFRIFDRWGTLLFETDDINVGWDCTYKGNLCQMGAYMYDVSYQRKEENGKLYRKTGTFMLMN